MAPLFWLEITDWKKESAQVSDPKPLFSDSFSSNCWKTKITKDSLTYLSIKYFDNEADLDVNKVNSKFKHFIEKIPINYESNNNKLFSDFAKSFAYNKFYIIASRSIISRIMNTPFQINNDSRRKWSINAEIFKQDGIYLYYDCNGDTNNDIKVQMAKQYELLKRYLFVKYPVRYYRKVISPISEIFGQLFHIELENVKLYYTTEIPGVISDDEITNRQQLQNAEHIYCDVFEAEDFSQDIINYNPIWWSKAKLSCAKQCILASYDKDNDCLKEIYKFNMDKFQDKTKYENLWSPDAAWNFLSDFMNFIKDSVNSVSCDIQTKCVWKFQSFPNHEPFVSCEILIRQTENGQETLTPITFNETNFP